MTVDFNDNTPLGDITITKLADGIYAEDKGNYRRRFTDAEALRWEFEYPQSLVAEINAMPVGEGTLETYMNHDALNAYMNMQPGMEELIAAMRAANHKKTRGTNMTPKKKKRKKNK